MSASQSLLGIEEKQIASSSSSSSSSPTSSLNLINSNVIIKGTKLFFSESFPWYIINLSELTLFLKTHGIKSIYLNGDISKKKIASDIIASLPPKINKLTLNDVLLSSKKLTQLITALKDKRTITRLSIRNISLTDAHAEQLASLLSENLISFRLIEHFGNNSSPNAITTLFQAVPNSTMLEKISLRLCTLNKPAQQALSSLLSQENSPLRSLTLKSCELNDQILESIASSMRENGSMTQLNFDNFDSSFMKNDISPIGLTHIGTMLAKNKIESLSLRNSDLNTPDCIQALTDILSKDKTLKKLTLRGTRFSRSSSTALASYLGNHPSLLYLDLSNCSLNGDHSAALFNAMAQGNSSISFLNLDLNHDLDFISLKDMLACNRTICELILSETLLNRYFMKGNPIFEALRDNENSRVTSLNLSGNTLDHQAILSLIKLLEKNKKIRTLSLSGCYISYNELKQLAEMLIVNTSLSSLDLSSISDSDAHTFTDFNINQITTHFQAALEKNKNITEFKLSFKNNDSYLAYTPVGISHINQLLKRNREHHRITAATAIFQHGTAVVSNESKNAISAIVPYILSFTNSAYLPSLRAPLATGYLRTISFFKENRTPNKKIIHALSKLYALCQASDREKNKEDLKSSSQPAEEVFNQLLTNIAENKGDAIQADLDNLINTIDKNFTDKDPAKITFTKVLAKYLLDSLPEVVEREQFKEFKPKLI